jgi:hypothetical protein
MRVFFAFLICLFVIVPATASAQNYPGEGQPSQDGVVVSGPVCGDGTCDYPTEKKGNCQEDCNWKKNDGKCERKKGERKKNSPKDCGGNVNPPSSGGTDPVVTTPATTAVTPGMMTGEMIFLVISLFLNVLALVLIIVLFCKQRSLRRLVNKIFDMLEGEGGD